MVRGFRLVVNGVCARVGECRSARSIVAVFLVAVGERHGSAVYAFSRRDDRCDLFLAGVIRAGCCHGNGQLRRFDLDGHISGRSRVFLIALGRGECPLSLIVAGFVGLGTRIRPIEGAFDRLAVVFHRASNGADAQDLAKGDWRCGDLAVQHGNDLVLRDDFNGQEHVLIVVRGDLDAYGSDGTFGLRFDSRDSQLELIV